MGCCLTDFAFSWRSRYLQTLLLLVTGPPAAIMDPAVLIAVLSSLRQWILEPAFAQGPPPLRL